MAKLARRCSGRERLWVATLYRTLSSTLTKYRKTPLHVADGMRQYRIYLYREVGLIVLPNVRGAAELVLRELGQKAIMLLYGARYVWCPIALDKKFQ